jgi:pimeloyl-ACP methyl ester carboxylesterase
MRLKSFTFLILVTALSFGVYAQGSKPAEKWATFDANKIRYYDIGDQKKKSAIVFIHGWTGNADLWKDSYSAFANHRVIAMDLIGHGKSDKPKVEYTMDLFARSVDAVLKDAKVDKAVFVGHSMGMPIARQIYRTNPQKVLGIVNVDGSIRAFPDRKQFDGWIANFRSNYQKTRDEFVGGMLATIKDENVKLSILNSNQATPDYYGISAISQLGNDALWNTDQIKVPVLGIFAESPWWPPDTEPFLRSIAPDLEFHMWKGPTHFLMMEKPKEFNDLIQAFVAKKKLL